MGFVVEDDKVMDRRTDGASESQSWGRVGRKMDGGGRATTNDEGVCQRVVGHS